MDYEKMMDENLSKIRLSLLLQMEKDLINDASFKDQSIVNEELIGVYREFFREFRRIICYEAKFLSDF